MNTDKLNQLADKFLKMAEHRKDEEHKKEKEKKCVECGRSIKEDKCSGCGKNQNHCDCDWSEEEKSKGLHLAKVTEVAEKFISKLAKKSFR